MWYKTKIKYHALVNGEVKTLTECYVHDAVSYGEVELQCYEHLKTRIKDPHIDSISKPQLTEVIFYKMQDEDAFYTVKVVVADEKKVTWTYLIPAISVEEAADRIRDWLKSMLTSIEVAGVVKSDVLAVWHPHSELWQGDWHNRMETLADFGRKSPDLNQMSIFDVDNESTEPATGMVVYRNQDVEDAGYADFADQDRHLPGTERRLLPEPEPETADIDD